MNSIETDHPKMVKWIKEGRCWKCGTKLTKGKEPWCKKCKTVR